MEYLKMKEIKLVFEFKKTINRSMNNNYFHFVKDESKNKSIVSNSMLKNNNILDKLVNSSFQFIIEDIDYLCENGEIRDFTIKLKEV